MMKKTVSGLIFMTAWYLILTVQAIAFDAELYQKILNKYIIPGKMLAGIRMNVVDYDGLLAEKNNQNSDFSQLLKSIGTYNPFKGTSADDQIAFWINAYNIGAINLILMNYPVDSIRSMKINMFKNPWGEKAIRINGSWYSLEKIEHGILLGEYKEKMAHFGIVCASVSCPELSRTVYTGKNLKVQLATQARIFFNSRYKGIKINRANRTVYVSSIFKFDSKNFSRGRDDIIPFILPYIFGNEDREYLKESAYKIKYLPYNWDINSLGGVR
jgi:hypothetical protein